MIGDRTIKVLAVLAILVAGIVALRAPGDPRPSVVPRDMESAEDGTTPEVSIGMVTDNDREVVSVGSGSNGASGGDAMGRVRVFVHTGDSMPVARAGVILNNGRSATTGDDGWVALDVPPGRYLVCVDREALPKGTTTSTLQGMPPPNYEVPAGYYSQVVHATAGQEVEARLRVFVSATITGMVVDEAGVPLSGIHVRAQCRAVGLSGLSVDAKTRVDGLYVLEGILPNVYTIEAHPERGGVLPVRFEVLEGVAYTLAPLVVGGNGVVTGRVVNQDGQPCAKVPVVAYASEDSVKPGEIGFNLSNAVGRVETSATGVFRLEGLPIGSLRIQVHPEGALVPDGDGSRLVRPPEALTVDLAHEIVAELGDVEVELSRPFRLRLQVDVDENAIRRVNPTLPSAIRERVYIVLESNLRDESKWEKLAKDDGRYLFRCETPSPSLCVIVRISGVPDRVIRFDPKPLDVVDASVSYP